MMFLIIMVATIIVLNILMPPPGKETKYTGKKEKPWCPPHVWVYGEDGFLFCQDCKTKPGYNPRE